MGQVGDLIGAQRTPAASMIGPAEDTGVEEGAIDDQLPTVLEKIEQACLTLGSVELVLLLHRHPRHPSTLRGQRIASLCQEKGVSMSEVVYVSKVRIERKVGPLRIE